MSVKHTFIAALLVISSISCVATRFTYDAIQACRLLGYDPQITLLKESDQHVVRSGRKTLYLHGFGGNKDTASVLKQYHGSERLPGDVVTFDFADANNGTMDTTKSSLGQWNDIKTALYVLNTLHESGETEIGITAHSRGGATAINMVAVLVDRTGQYDDRLAELGIDAVRRKALVSMLQNGHIVLECPLIDVRAVIQHHIEESSSAASLRSWFSSGASSSSLTYSSATALDYAAPVVLRKYRPWAEQAVKSVESWRDVRIPTILHFQEVDEVLGNARNSEFYAKLKAANGQDVTFIHQGNDGGHNSSFKSFAYARNRFLKEHGASYHTRRATR